ncbi:hypothetical protein [Phenylobacterium sp. J367]|nr:hypothetical protein [Phenylobacterium sp. J367]
MPLKAFLAAAAAIAVSVGLLLPVPHASEAAASSQFETLDLGQG